MRHDWARTALTVLGMAVIIFIFFILNAFSHSLHSFNQTSDTGRILIVIQGDLIDPSEAVLDNDAIQAAEMMSSDLVNRVSPIIFRHLRINDHIVMLRASRVEDWESVSHMEILEGKVPEGFGEVAVGEGAEKANGWKIGTTLNIYGREFNVTAIVRLPGSAFASVWIPLAQGQELFGMDRGYQYMLVQVSQGADAEEVKQLLQNNPHLAGRYSVFFEDTFSQRNTLILKDISNLMKIASNLALLAVTFGTYNSTNLSLAERGREIGILRAVGFSHNTLEKLLGIRAILQGLIAFIAGFAAAQGYIAYQQAFAQIFILGYPILFETTWQQLMVGILLTSILAWLGAWLSSRRMLLLDVNHLLKD
jgi:ABC-type antimicrobial peptide transport system permease subunit